MAAEGVRLSRLNKVFGDFIYGSRSVSTARDAELFFEALRSQVSPSACLEALFTGKQGIAALQYSVRASQTLQFVKVQLLPSIAVFDNPEAKALCSGEFLNQVISAVVEPPTAWNAIVGHYTAGSLVEKDVDAFAWLCIEVLSHPNPELDSLTNEINDILQEHPLVTNPSSKARQLGYRIDKILRLKLSSGAVAESDTDGPGGRHDNDFEDFRKVSIYPTRDELSSTTIPFYRRAREIAECDPVERTGRHLDNQFRLLREDMLAELRDDILIATRKKKGRRRGLELGNLCPVGIDTGKDRHYRPCALLLSVGFGLEQLTMLPVANRKGHLRNNPFLLKTHSFGALCRNDDVVGFAFVVRDIDYLAREPPVVSLQFSSSDAVRVALSNFQESPDMKFLIIDTPVYAYEPVLERLKEIMELPLEKQLLQIDGDKSATTSTPSTSPVSSAVLELSNPQQSSPSLPPSAPSAQLDRFIQRSDVESADTHLRIEDKSYYLDEAQIEALTCALEQPLAVIQGPPGTLQRLIRY